MNTVSFPKKGLALAFMISLSQISFAHDHDYGHDQKNHDNHDHHEHHGAHVHGIANANLVIENKDIYFELIAPADTIVGFEHAASTPPEKEKVANAKQLLVNAVQLFSFESGDCKAVDVAIDMSGLVASDGHTHDSHDHEHEHEHEHEHDHSDEKTHGKHIEVTASYQFSCKSITQAPQVELSFFRYFKTLEQLRVEWVNYTANGRTQQGMKKLTSNDPKLTLHKH